MIVQALMGAISPLGENGMRLVIANLPYQGVFLADPDLTLATIARGIYGLFGDGAGHMVLETMLLELDRLASMASITE